jgi:4-amino-4-deoxy-L-arabinose transferase-like glycosyltransferase
MLKTWILRYPYYSLFFLALGLRVCVLCCFWNNSFPVFTDQDKYLELGESIVQGQGLKGELFRTPLYPAYIALHYSIFGETTRIALRISQALFSAFLPLVMVWWGLQCFRKEEAWLAGILAAIYPFFCVYPLFILTESHFVLFLFLFLILFHFSWKNACRGCFLGVWNGLVILYRPSHLHFLFFLAGLLLIGFPRETLKRWKLLASAFLGTLLVLSPWIYRNYQMTHHFVPTTVHLGWFLYVGNCDQADGSAIDSQIKEKPEVLALSAYERDQYYFKEALTWIREHPQRFLELVGIRLWRTWNIFPNFQSFQNIGVSFVCVTVIAPLLFLGLLGLLRSPKTVEWLLLASPIFYYTLIHSITVGSIRYRLPAMPGVLFFVAIQMVYFYDIFKKRFRKK